MNHFFVEPEDIRGDLVIIRGQDVKHITRSLRLQPGDEITVADGLENKYLVELTATNDKLVEGEIKKELEVDAESDINVTLLQGLPKSKKMDLIVRKCTELGIDKVIPMETDHTVVKLSSSKAEKRKKRWQKIAKSAAKQSKRTRIPLVEDVINFESGLELVADYDLAVMPWVAEEKQGLKDIIQQQNTKEIEDVLIIIGPEGGFSPQEVASAREEGVQPVLLGPRTLRTETAGLAVLTMLLYELGDLGG
ncbi:16S rRNA (uracil(1498)-N(3))-methyltransferase [Halanaerobacter jeridensis]|uniref:Ribosomal RNA small subunit methyltransferase E n=1 Tax=Halanaerobacter jeridensis TaxID=706427 RepID=A0A939BME2_9FIRM|nr:16S rRNA (uracil(1498)-N(3))-methyltransferase [Halanaerobacter jeridensis]MBM7556235.1 16S rRNA (uracil1498-N3)-methyltransferase [Halanaerobacter jeridensis]